MCIIILFRLIIGKKKKNLHITYVVIYIYIYIYPVFVFVSFFFFFCLYFCDEVLKENYICINVVLFNVKKC